MTDCVGQDFRIYKFLATGAATTLRAFPDRLAETINVKEFGAVGDGVANDEAKCQAAINEAINRGGGQVIFPGPATYKLSTSGFLTVGSANPIRIDLIGGGKDSTIINGSTTSTPLISKGTGAIDNIGKIEGLGLLASGGPSALIKIEGTNQSVNNIEFPAIAAGKIGIDATAATNAVVWNCHGGSGAAANPANNVAPGYPANTTGILLGNSCTAINCRIQGGDIAYGLSGVGPGMYACSSEVTNTGAKVGWGIVGGVQAEVPCFGFTISGYQTEEAGQRASQGGAAIVFYNCQGGLVSGVVNQVDPLGSGLVPNSPITSMTWAAGIATVTTTGNHNIPVGNLTLALSLAAANSTWLPSYAGPQALALATSTNPASNTFTYALAASPSAWVAAQGDTWSYTTSYQYRFRKCRGVVIQGGGAGGQIGEASFDFDYLGQAQNHSDNVLYGVATNRGSWLPQSANPNRRTILAGWTFYGCTTGANPLDGNASWRPVGYTAISPNGNMLFADLPGQAGAIGGQDGPFVGQEYDITDGTLAASGNFAATQTGGGANKTRVRWNGSNWIIAG